MAEIFNPDLYVNKVLPQNVLDRLLTQDLTLRQTELKAITIATSLSDKAVTAGVLSALQLYRKKAKSSANIKLAKKEIASNAKLVISRLKELVIYSRVEELKKENAGKSYRWLPSSAIVPSPQHQLLYGKIFPVGKGDNEGFMPGERFGCKCGIEFLDK